MTPEQKILRQFGFNLRAQDPKYEREFQGIYRCLWQEMLLDEDDYMNAWHYAELELAICFFLEEG